MPKNPLSEYFRQQGIKPIPDSKRKSIPIISPLGLSGARYNRFAEFSCHLSKLPHKSAIIDTIYGHPHPTDVLADSSLFSPKRLNFVQRLLISTPILVLPSVIKELLDIEKDKPGPLKDLIFPDGSLNSRLQIDRHSSISSHEFAFTRYINMLHLRKQLLNGQFERYEQKNGVPPRGKDREKIIRKAQLNGVSWRTIRLAAKGDPRFRFTDEILSVYGIMRPILTGRDCFILTTDNDIFDQVYQFCNILHEDYGSFLIGRDYSNNPQKYPHTHTSSSPLMLAGALAIGRKQHPSYLYPVKVDTCATCVINVETLDCLVWISIQQIRSALDFQESSGDGRVGDGGNGNSVHMMLHDQGCREFKYHFTIGREKYLKSKTGAPTFISEFDLIRACTD